MPAHNVNGQKLIIQIKIPPFITLRHHRRNIAAGGGHVAARRAHLRPETRIARVALRCCGSLQFSFRSEQGVYFIVWTLVRSSSDSIQAEI